MNTGSNSSIPPRHLGHGYPKSLRFAEDETTVTDASSSSATTHAQDGRMAGSSKDVVLLKIIVIFILILSALMLSFLTYYLITQDESDDFTNQFADFATKVMEEFLDITHLKVYTCYSLSIAYTTEYEGTAECLASCFLESISRQDVWQHGLGTSFLYWLCTLRDGSNTTWMGNVCLQCSSFPRFGGQLGIGSHYTSWQHSSIQGFG